MALSWALRNSVTQSPISCFLCCHIPHSTSGAHPLIWQVWRWLIKISACIRFRLKWHWQFLRRDSKIVVIMWAKWLSIVQCTKLTSPRTVTGWLWPAAQTGCKMWRATKPLSVHACLRTMTMGTGRAASQRSRWPGSPMTLRFDDDLACPRKSAITCSDRARRSSIWRICLAWLHRKLSRTASGAATQDKFVKLMI